MFGVLIDVPLLTASFIILAVYRGRLADSLAWTGVPAFVVFLLVAAPLIVFEEQIDCMPAWCGKVVIPPTLYFLELEMLVLGVLVVGVHARSAARVALAFSVYGVLFEYLPGGPQGPRAVPGGRLSGSVRRRGLRLRLPAPAGGPRPRDAAPARIKVERKQPS